MYRALGGKICEGMRRLESGGVTERVAERVLGGRERKREQEGNMAQSEGLLHTGL